MVPVSPWENLVRSIVGFPKYALEYTIGLIIAILTDLHITTLAITAVIGGFVFGSVLGAIFLFFIVYTLSRVASNTANAVGSAGNQIAASNSQVARAIHSILQAQIPVEDVEANGPSD